MEGDSAGNGDHAESSRAEAEAVQRGAGEPIEAAGAGEGERGSGGVMEGEGGVGERDRAAATEARNDERGAPGRRSKEGTSGRRIGGRDASGRGGGEKLAGEGLKARGEGRRRSEGAAEPNGEPKERGAGPRKGEHAVRGSAGNATSSPRSHRSSGAASATARTPGSSIISPRNAASSVTAAARADGAGAAAESAGGGTDSAGAKTESAGTPGESTGAAAEGAGAAREVAAGPAASAERNDNGGGAEGGADGEGAGEGGSVAGGGRGPAQGIGGAGGSEQTTQREVADEAVRNHDGGSNEGGSKRGGEQGASEGGEGLQGGSRPEQEQVRAAQHSSAMGDQEIEEAARSRAGERHGGEEEGKVEGGRAVRGRLESRLGAAGDIASPRLLAPPLPAAASAPAVPTAEGAAPAAAAPGASAAEGGAEQAAWGAQGKEQAGGRPAWHDVMGWGARVVRSLAKGGLGGKRAGRGGGGKGKGGAETEGEEEARAEEEAAWDAYVLAGDASAGGDGVVVLPLGPAGMPRTHTAGEVWAAPPSAGAAVAGLGGVQRSGAGVGWAQAAFPRSHSDSVRESRAGRRAASLLAPAGAGGDVWAGAAAAERVVVLRTSGEGGADREVQQSGVGRAMVKSADAEGERGGGGAEGEAGRGARAEERGEEAGSKRAASGVAEQSAAEASKARADAALAAAVMAANASTKPQWATQHQWHTQPHDQQQGQGGGAGTEAEAMEEERKRAEEAEKKRAWDEAVRAVRLREQQRRQQAAAALAAAEDAARGSRGGQAVGRAAARRLARRRRKVVARLVAETAPRVDQPRPPAPRPAAARGQEQRAQLQHMIQQLESQLLQLERHEGLLREGNSQVGGQVKGSRALGPVVEAYRVEPGEGSTILHIFHQASRRMRSMEAGDFEIAECELFTARDDVDDLRAHPNLLSEHMLICLLRQSSPFISIHLSAGFRDLIMCLTALGQLFKFLRILNSSLQMYTGALKLASHIIHRTPPPKTEIYRRHAFGAVTSPDRFASTPRSATFGPSTQPHSFPSTQPLSFPDPPLPRPAHHPPARRRTFFRSRSAANPSSHSSRSPRSSPRRHKRTAGGGAEGYGSDEDAAGRPYPQAYGGVAVGGGPWEDGVSSTDGESPRGGGSMEEATLTEVSEWEEVGDDDTDVDLRHLRASELDLLGPPSASPLRPRLRPRTPTTLWLRHRHRHHRSSGGGSGWGAGAQQGRGGDVASPYSSGRRGGGGHGEFPNPSTPSSGNAAAGALRLGRTTSTRVVTAVARVLPPPAPSAPAATPPAAGAGGAGAGAKGTPTEWSALSSAQLDPYGVFGEHLCPDAGNYIQMLAVQHPPSEATMTHADATRLLHFRAMAAQLEEVDPSLLSHNERLAFWINIYNALLLYIYIVIPTPTDFADRIALFSKVGFLIGGQLYSVLLIEHAVLRAATHKPYIIRALPSTTFRPDDARSLCVLSRAEPLVSFALCSGTRSSPSMRVYRAESVQQQLRGAMVEYLGAAVSVNEANKIIIPKLLQWYLPDFAPDVWSLLEWLANVLPTNQAVVLMNCLPTGAANVSASKCVVVAPFDYRFRYLIPPVLPN
ncbi:unnamed protein product [Closterium sp. Yama58-4]|nr:unnamed protein product [Closterium sp. Yama58-4]